MALLEKALKPDTAWETLNLIPLLVLAQAILILTFEFYQVEMNLCRSRRRDFQDPNLTQRPPPASVNPPRLYLLQTWPILRHRIGLLAITSPFKDTYCRRFRSRASGIES